MEKQQMRISSDSQQHQEEATQLIPNYTLDDFLSERPYEWLYSQKDNKFMLQILLTKLQVMAKAVGFTGFVKTWNAYVESKSPKATILGSNQTMFPNQPIQLECGSYVADEYGVAALDRFGNEITVCQHPIMPIARIIDQDTGNQQLRIAFQRGGGKWKTEDVDKSVAYSAGKAADYLSGKGVAVTSESGKYLVKYLCDLESLNFDTLPEIQTTSRLGWHGNAFVPYANALHYSDTGNHQIVGFIKRQGDFDMWLNAIKATRDGAAQHLPARMAVAASFASPLLSRIGYLPFWVNLHSTISSSGKTVCIMLAASVWGKPDVGHGLPISANATTNALEVIASSLNNIPLFVDELQAAQKEKGFAQTAYNLCEGAGRGRLNRGAKLQSLLHWCLVTISSGEQSVTNDLDHEGALARVVEIAVKQPIFSDPHTLVNIVKGNYGYAGHAFVEAIAGEDWGAIKKEADRISRSLQASGIQLKQADSGAILILADHLASKFIFHDFENALTEEDVRQYLKLESETDMNRRVYEHVCGWCLQFKGYFESEDNPHVKEFFGKQMSDTHFRIAKNPLKAELHRNGFDFDSFVEWCVLHKAMTDKSGTPAKQHREQHQIQKSARLLDFFTNVFDEEPKTEPANIGTVVNATEVPDFPF